MDSLNNLDRLLKAEADAAALIRDAETQKGALLSQAREKARAEEKEKLTRQRAEHEAALAAFRSSIQSKVQMELDEYEKRLEDSPRDEAAFARACREFMFPGA